jgi:Iap family predicted aminopeptidase
VEQNPIESDNRTDERMFLVRKPSKRNQSYGTRYRTVTQFHLPTVTFKMLKLLLKDCRVTTIKQRNTTTMSKKYTRKQALTEQLATLQMKENELMTEYYTLKVEMMKKKLFELENELSLLEHEFIFS